jgi:hypothetical protein
LAKKQKFEEAFKILSDYMDKRDEFYKLLQEEVDKNKKGSTPEDEYNAVPLQYKSDWAAYVKDGKRPWKRNRKAYMKIRKTAKMAAKNDVAMETLRSEIKNLVDKMGK